MATADPVSPRDHIDQDGIKQNSPGAKREGEEVNRGNEAGNVVDNSVGDVLATENIGEIIKPGGVDTSVGQFSQFIQQEVRSRQHF